MNQDTLDLKLHSPEILHLGGCPDLVPGGRPLLIVTSWSSPSQTYFHGLSISLFMFPSSQRKVQYSTWRNDVSLSSKVEVERLGRGDPVEVTSWDNVMERKLGSTTVTLGNMICVLSSWKQHIIIFGMFRFLIIYQYRGQDNSAHFILSQYLLKLQEVVVEISGLKTSFIAKHLSVYKLFHRQTHQDCQF